EIAGALANLRELARGIYPPLLADLGIAAALDAQARKAPVPVSGEADGIGRYPQEIEAAVEFRAPEAPRRAAGQAGAGHAPGGPSTGHAQRAGRAGRRLPGFRRRAQTVTTAICDAGPATGPGR